MTSRTLMLTSLLSAIAAPALAESPKYEAAVQFLEPLVGFHHLEGDAGCENLEIDKNESGSTYGVLVRTGGRTLGAKLADPYIQEKALSVSENSLQLDQRIYSGHFNLKGWGVKAKVRTHRDGSIREVSVTETRYNEFGVAETLHSFRCFSK
jgi:hypothetical protein